MEAAVSTERRRGLFLCFNQHYPGGPGRKLTTNMIFQSKHPCIAVEVKTDHLKAVRSEDCSQFLTFFARCEAGRLLLILFDTTARADAPLAKSTGPCSRFPSPGGSWVCVCSSGSGGSLPHSALSVSCGLHGPLSL